MLVAEYGLPLYYVRPEKHGRQNQVEGFFTGQNVVVVEKFDTLEIVVY
jgi:orotate phosphoribosyltransferase